MLKRKPLLLVSATVEEGRIYAAEAGIKPHAILSISAGHIKECLLSRKTYSMLLTPGAGLCMTKKNMKEIARFYDGAVTP